MQIVPKVVKASESVFQELEERGILTRFFSSYASTSVAEGSCLEDTLYSTDPKFGSHKVICVNYNESEPYLSYHSDKESFILVSDAPEKYKNLYLFLSFLRVEELVKRIERRELSKDDLLIVQLEFNNPNLSFFTLNAFVPHCELTDSGASGLTHPYFYVAEPTDLDNILIDLEPYEIVFEK